MKKVYYFTITRIDHWAPMGTKIERQIWRCENLLEAFKKRKWSQKNDFYLEGNYERWTSILNFDWVPDEPVSHKHGLVLGYKSNEPCQGFEEEDDILKKDESLFILEEEEDEDDILF